MNQLHRMKRVSVVCLWAFVFLVGPVDAPAAWPAAKGGQPPPREVHLINTARIPIRFTLLDTRGNEREFKLEPAEEKSFRNADKIKICTNGHPCEETSLSSGRRYEIQHDPKRNVWFVTESSQ